MNWLAWWAALCMGAAVWLCMRAPHARLRDTHHAPGVHADEAHTDSGNQGVSVVLAGVVASLQGGVGVLEALCRQFEMPQQHARASPLSNPHGAALPGLVAHTAVTDANGDCDADAIAALLQTHRLTEETDAQIRAAAHGICAAYGVSRRLGCPAARCFEAVRESYARLRLREDLRRNAFAVPRSTVRMLMGLPAVTVALGELLGAHPLSVLFGSVQGMCCLLLGSICYAVGAAWMHRLMLAMIGTPP